MLDLDGMPLRLLSLLSMLLESVCVVAASLLLVLWVEEGFLTQAPLWHALQFQVHGVAGVVSRELCPSLRAGFVVVCHIKHVECS